MRRLLAFSQAAAHLGIVAGIVANGNRDRLYLPSEFLTMTTAAYPS